MPDSTVAETARAFQSNWPADIFDVMFIPLTKGKFATIDSADLPLVNKAKWYAKYAKAGHWYALSLTGQGKRGKPLRMHRIVAAATDQQVVDHRDNNGLNNRRQNVRACSISQNQAARHVQNTNRTGFRGVHFLPKTRRFRAVIQKDRRSHFIGLYRTAIQAARAYDRAATKLHGEFAMKNFPLRAQDKKILPTGGGTIVA